MAEVTLGCEGSKWQSDFVLDKNERKTSLKGNL
jgi:hypothetical protein